MSGTFLVSREKRDLRFMHAVGSKEVDRVGNRIE